MATNLPPNNNNNNDGVENLDGQEHSHGSGSVDDRYERTDARNSAVLMVGLVLFAAAVLTALAMIYYVRFGFERAAAGDRPLTAITPEEIAKTEFQGSLNLQLSPRLEMNEYREITSHTLHTYGWVNKDVNVARIPIDEAMKITLERGLPTRRPEVAAAFIDDGTSAAQDSSGGRTFRNRLR